MCEAVETEDRVYCKYYGWLVALSRSLKLESARVKVPQVIFDAVVLEVVDDGCGMPAEVNASGLINLRRRAYEVGGDFTVGDAPDGGTVLRWTAPLP